MLRAHHILLCKSTSLLISECLPFFLIYFNATYLYCLGLSVKQKKLN
jgi:hypothetical protein